jgi:hypothetical protein
VFVIVRVCGGGGGVVWVCVCARARERVCVCVCMHMLLPAPTKGILWIANHDDQPSSSPSLPELAWEVTNSDVRGK